jgi:hypothetical protein
MTMEEAMNLLNRDDRFKATVAAINILLIRKGIYTQEEFEGYFIESATATIRKNNAPNNGARRPAAAEIV